MRDLSLFLSSPIMLIKLFNLSTFIILVFILGSLPILWIKSLNHYHLICFIALIFICFLIIVFLFFKLRLSILSFLLLFLSFFLAGYLSTNKGIHYLESILPYIDKTINTEAKIISLGFNKILYPDSKYNFVKIEVYKIEDHNLDNPILMNVLWEDKPNILAGQNWRLKIKTKVIHSHLNEGGFDSQRFYLSKQELLTGTIKTAELINSNFSLRQKIATKFLFYSSLTDYSDLMLALGFGDRSLLTSEHKKLLFETGIIHLLAISGMHIILVYLLMFYTFSFIQTKINFKYGIYWFPILFSFALALIYGILTGLSPPTQRTLLALTCWIGFKCIKISCSTWHKLLYIIFLLLLINPLMILSESFWLSCYAVFCLLFISHFFPLHLETHSKSIRYFIQLLFLQGLLTFLLLPIQAFLFQGVSIASIPANLIAIPLISLVVFPTILLLILSAQCSFLYYISLFLTMIIDKALSLLFYLLQFIADFWIILPHAFLLFSGLGWLLLLAYRFNLLYRYALLWCFIILIMWAPYLKKETYLWRLDQIDIGHGLSIVIQKNGKAIVYDVGASTETSTKAERTLLPFLDYHQLTLEKIIISHQDNDHVGGLSSVQNRYPNAKLISSSTSLNNHIDCIAGSNFEWQNLTFTVLWPLKTFELAKNPESCVIQVSDGIHKILLTGDLEAKQELYLAQHFAAQLKSDILQVPHHGSKTSSTYAFLAQVAPEVALISTSRYNPWNLPAKIQLQKYKELNIPYLTSAQSGQITIQFYQDHYDVFEYRTQIKPRWYHDWFG